MKKSLSVDTYFNNSKKKKKAQNNWLPINLYVTQVKQKKKRKIFFKTGLEKLSFLEKLVWNEKDKT